MTNAVNVRFHLQKDYKIKIKRSLQIFLLRVFNYYISIAMKFQGKLKLFARDRTEIKTLNLEPQIPK